MNTSDDDSRLMDNSSMRNAWLTKVEQLTAAFVTGRSNVLASERAPNVPMFLTPVTRAAALAS